MGRETNTQLKTKWSQRAIPYNKSEIFLQSIFSLSYSILKAFFSLGGELK